MNVNMLKFIIGGNMKTKYRLVRIKVDDFSDPEYFIQFFRGINSSWFGMVKKEDWRFIPKDAIAAKGDWESPDACPLAGDLKDYIVGNWSCTINSMRSGDKTSLEWFMKKYPDIQQYFDFLKIDIDAMKERERKKKEKESKRKKVIYYE